MRLAYLYEHTAELLKTAVAVYSWPKEAPFRPAHRYLAEGMELPLPPTEMEQTAASAFPQAFPQLFCVGRHSYYALVFTQDEFCLVGPVRLAAPLLLFNELPGSEDGEPERLPLCDVPVFFQAVLLLHNVYHDIPVSMRQLVAANCRSDVLNEIQQRALKLVFDNREQGRRHNSYQQEQRLMESIEKGDLQLLQASRQDALSGEELGKLAPDMERSMRNVCISVITLASRAAIRGGVHPELAFSLCDTYITKIEELTDLWNMPIIVEGAEAHFARMVNALHKGVFPREEQLRHPLVERGKDYIHTHLHGKIVLGEVADLLGTNPSYLSELFKRYEGLAFSDFVMREKIELAKSLLIYSPASFSEITVNLGFSSQSHLGRHFKKLTGLTLMQFRNQFGIAADTRTGSIAD